MESRQNNGRESVFLERLENILKKESWIIDGNYASTMEQRLAVCDTVIFLDYPRDICLKGARERIGKPRCDMPWVESEEDSEFIEFINQYNEKQRPSVLKLLEKHTDKNVIIFRSRKEADAFLKDKLK